MPQQPRAFLSLPAGKELRELPAPQRPWMWDLPQQRTGIPNHLGQRKGWGLGMNAQSLLVERPLCFLFSHYVNKTYLGVPFCLLSFPRGGLREPPAAGREVRLLFLIARRAVWEGLVLQKGVSPAPPTGLRGAPAGGDSFSRPRLAPISPHSAQFPPHPWVAKSLTPVPLFALGNLSRLLQLPHPHPAPSRHTHTSHGTCTVSHVYPVNIHRKPFTRTFSIVFAHAVKTFTPQQVTHDLDSLAYTYSHTDMHAFLHVEAHRVHARTRSCSPSALARALGAYGLARSSMVGQAGETRGSHPSGGVTDLGPETGPPLGILAWGNAPSFPQGLCSGRVQPSTPHPKGAAPDLGLPQATTHTRPEPVAKILDSWTSSLGHQTHTPEPP